MQATMDHLVQSLLSQRWVTLHGGLPRLNDARYPGVYLLAYSDKGLHGKAIDLHDVFYVGMSNSQGGVRQRLRFFMQAIEGEGEHSGGRRFFREYAGGVPYSRLHGGMTLYVASVSIPCIVDKATRTADDLRRMGDLAALEYYVLAHVKEILGREPELNKK